MGEELTNALKSVEKEKVDQASKLVDTITTAQLLATFSNVQSKQITTRPLHSNQNVCLIWLDSTIDQSNEDYRKTLADIRRVAGTIDIFTDCDQCVDFISETNNKEIFMIVSGYLGRDLIPIIHDVSQLVVIYVFCENRVLHEQWTTKWIKVKGVFTEIESICQAITQTLHEFDIDYTKFNFDLPDIVISENTGKLDPSFMYTKILTETLLQIKYDEQSIKNFVRYCRTFYSTNIRWLEWIDVFEQEFHNRTPIWWYTSDSFLYQMLNRALRNLEIDAVINMGFFIRALHQQIEQLHSEQFTRYHDRLHVVYRGQCVPQGEFETLMAKKGGLISFNTFLATTKSKDVALMFIGHNTDLIRILFMITIDSSISSVPFADISQLSRFQEEEEVLFSMHTVFCIQDITRIDNEEQLWQVELRLTDGNDKDLLVLTERFREEIRGSTAWHELGELLIKLGEWTKAEEIYMALIDHTSDHVEQALLYHQLARIKDQQGKYSEAISLYEKSIETYQNMVPQNYHGLATALNNIGAVYRRMGNYSKALSFCQKGMKNYQTFLPPNHPSLAVSHDNIGSIYAEMHQYPKALSCYEKALAISQQSLPPTHPQLASFYSNLGTVYREIGEYKKALFYFERALAINQQSLPSNHPDLATSYSKTGLVYGEIEEYTKALSFCEKALDIHLQSLPSNHPDLATSYTNIGSIYQKMGAYSKALSIFEEALDICQKVLSANHPDLIRLHMNITRMQSEISKSIDIKTIHKGVDTATVENPITTDTSGSYDERHKTSDSDNTSQLSSTKTDEQSAPVYYSALMDLSLEPSKNYHSFFSRPNPGITTCDQSSLVSRRVNRQLYYKSESDDKPNTIVVCLDIDSSCVQPNAPYKPKFFHEECDCMDYLLSITDKYVYFVVSVTVGELIIPLMHEHRCIEKIYIYHSNTEENGIDWIKENSKIRNCWTDFDELYATLIEDMQSNPLHSIPWPGDKLLNHSHTQTSLDSSSWSPIPLNISNAIHSLILNDQIRIVILHCGRHIFFKATCNKQFLLVDFSNSAECKEYLESTNAKSIFFIISGGGGYVLHDLQSIIKVNCIYTVYVFMPTIGQTELNEKILQYKNVSGLFYSIKDIYIHLEADIRLYVEESLYMPIPYVFTTKTYMKNKFGLQLTYEQEKFAAFQILLNVLKQIPLNPCRQQQLYDHCLALVKNELDYENVRAEIASRPDQLLNWFANVPFLGAMINSLFQEQDLNNLLDLQHLIVTVDERLAKLPHTSSSFTVYRAQLMQAHGLDLLKMHVGELLTFHTFLIATRNISTAREIAREAVNNGLLSVMLEIDVPTRTRVAKLDEDRVMFDFGNIFCIQSIDLAPDTVWYIRLRCADSHFEPIEEQLELQVGEPLSWITLGNYFCALQYSNEAKLYYDYLLKTLPENHEALPSIYNNMALIFIEMDEKEKALKCYNTALELIGKVSFNSNYHTSLTSYRTSDQMIEVALPINRSAVYDNIAEIHMHQSKPKQAADFYQKALAEATDRISRVKFEKKIQETLFKINEMSV